MQYSRDELNLYEKSKSQSKSSLTSSNSDDIGHFDAVDDGGMRRSQSSSELPSLAEEKLASSAVHETRSLSDVDGIIVRISPEKVLTLQSASLTAAQTKAITGEREWGEERALKAFLPSHAKFLNFLFGLSKDQVYFS